MPVPVSTEGVAVVNRPPTWDNVHAEAWVGLVLIVAVYAYLLVGGYVGLPWGAWA